MIDIEEILQKFPNLSRDMLIPVLQEIQDKYGYLPEDVINKIGKSLDLPASKIYGLTTFYNQFRYAPQGKYHLQICNGTGCHMNGSEYLFDQIVKSLNIQDGETTRDGMFSLEIRSCIGACGQGPVIAVNGEYHENTSKEKFKEIIQYYRHLEEKKYV
jgi:NADH-quinone oxidoreductase E subunit